MPGIAVRRSSVSSTSSESAPPVIHTSAQSSSTLSAVSGGAVSNVSASIVAAGGAPSAPAGRRNSGLFALPLSPITERSVDDLVLRTPVVGVRSGANDGSMAVLMMQMSQMMVTMQKSMESGLSQVVSGMSSLKDALKSREAAPSKRRGAAARRVWNGGRTVAATSERDGQTVDGIVRLAAEGGISGVGVGQETGNDGMSDPPSRKQMVKELKAARAVLSEQIATIKAAMAADINNAYKRLESCYQKQKKFTKHEQRLIAEVSERLEMRINHDKNVVLPAVRRVKNDVEMCLVAITRDFGSATVSAARQQMIKDDQYYLAGFANPFDWYRLHPHPEGTTAAEIKAMMQAMPARLLETLGAIAATKQVGVAKDQKLLYGVWPTSPFREAFAAAHMEEEDSAETQVATDMESKYENTCAAEEKKQSKRKERATEASDDDSEAERVVSLDSDDAPKRKHDRPRTDTNPVLTSILNTSRAGADDTYWDEESDGDDVVEMDEKKAPIRREEETAAPRREAASGSGAAGGGPPGGGDSGTESDSGSENERKTDGDTDHAEKDSDSDDEDEEEYYQRLHPADNNERDRAQRYLKRAIKKTGDKAARRRKAREMVKQSEQAVANFKTKRRGINLPKVLQAVKPDEQFIFDETKFPKVNITDSFKDFHDKLKHQLVVHSFGKAGAITHIKDIDDSILIHQFASWFKSARMRMAWLSGNLNTTFKERRRIFCKAHGLTRFMINAELRDCKWDGKEDLMVFEATLSTIEKRYCDANDHMVLDNAQLVNHFVDRLTAAPGLHEFAELYIHQEEAKGRDVTRQEILQQVHAKNSSYHMSQARKGRRGNMRNISEQSEKDGQSKQKGNQSLHVMVRDAVQEALKQESGHVNAIQKRDSYGLRNGARAHPAQSQQQQQWQPRCYNCQQIGHLSRDCPSPKIARAEPESATALSKSSAQNNIAAATSAAVHVISAPSTFAVKRVVHVTHLMNAMVHGRQDGLTYLKCQINGFNVDSCLVDTGCTVSGIISEELFQQLQKHDSTLKLEATDVKLESASKHPLEVCGECAVQLADPSTKSIGVVRLCVVRGLTHMAIIGNPVLMRGTQQKFRNGRSNFICPVADSKVIFPMYVHHSKAHDEDIDAVQAAFLIGLDSNSFHHSAAEERADALDEEITSDEVAFATDVQKAREFVMAIPKPEHLSEQQWLSLRDGVLLQFLDTMIWRKRDPDKQAELIGEHVIELLPDSKPFNKAPFGGTEQARAVLRNEVKKMDDDGIVSGSKSNYSSPAFVQRKPGSVPLTWRFLIDFRELNARTKKDVYPLPRIDQTIDSLRRAKFITIMDLKSGYFQIPIRKADRHLTAFKYDGGLAEFLFMAQGLCNAPSTFQRLMDKVLAGYKYDFCFAYLDDIVIFSVTFDEHVEHVRKVLERLRQYNLSLSPNKCHFAQHETKFLGHIVGNGAVRPDPAKIEAIKHMQPPTNHSQCRSFLGLVNYYRVFVKNFADIARPLHKLACSQGSFAMTADGMQAFEQLKLQLQEAPVLRCSDPSKPFFLYTDASNTAIGAVLAQQDEQGNDYPIAYLSRALHEPEMRYSVTERECLAVVWAVRKFHDYLGDREFTVFTDHNALKWLFTTDKLPNARLLRWVLSLQAYSFKVTHRAGKKHQNADALSRLPVKIEPVAVIAAPVSSTVNAKERLMKAQKEDPELEHVYEALSSLDCGGSPLSVTELDRAWKFISKHNLIMIAGIVYREEAMSGSSSVAKPRLVPYLPRVMRRDALASSHNGDASGHAGERMMYHNMREYFYWPRMMEDIRRCVAECGICQRAKTHFKAASVVPTLSLPIPTRPFGMIGMDALALPETRMGNNTLIVFTDYLTKWVEAVAVRCRKAGTPSSQQVAKALLEEIVCRHGIPDAMLSDQGTGFCQDVMLEVAQWLGIKSKTASPYHPQCNGLTERFNRTFIGMLRTYPGRLADKNWDVRLPLLLFAYRCHYNRNSQRSPFFMLHGFYPMIPGSVMTGVAAVAVRSRSEWLREVMQHLPTTWKHAVKMLEENAQLIKEENEQLLKEGKLRVYEVGDPVYVFDHRSDSQRIAFKEKPQWRGPVRVSKVITPATYEIEKVNRRGEIRTAIVWSGHLKPAKEIARQRQDIRDMMNQNHENIAWEVNDSDDEKKENEEKKDQNGI